MDNIFFLYIFEPLQLGVACRLGSERIIPWPEKEHWIEGDFIVAKIDLQKACVKAGLL